MKINFDKFVEWAESRFGGDVVVKGDEIRVNSIFAPDDKHHMWCSPSGGKKEREFGVYHCFKTDQKGSLVKLVKMVDKCSHDDAVRILCGHKTMAQLESSLDSLLCDNTVEIGGIAEAPKPALTLPAGSVLISDLGSNNWHRQRAEDYLDGRKIPIDGLHVCLEDPYKNRIIIPYYGRRGELIYWNSRHMSPNARLRYLGPPKECGVGKEDVVYMPGGWGAPGSTVHVCEGEFNAMSLMISDLLSCACGGKNMSDKQALLLSDYRVVVCLDRDKAGASGTSKMLNMLSAGRGVGGDRLSYVRPPDRYNDWNEMYVDSGAAIVHKWIKSRQKPVDFTAPHGMTSDGLKL